MNYIKAIHAFFLFFILGSLSLQQPPQLGGQIDEKFFSSVRTGDIETMMKYLNQGIDVSSKDSKGNTAMIIAAGRGQVEAMKILLEQGASYEEMTQLGLFQGKSALSWAASQGRAGATAVLLNAGANPHFPAMKGVFLGKVCLNYRLVVNTIS